MKKLRCLRYLMSFSICAIISVAECRFAHAQEENAEPLHNPRYKITDASPETLYLNLENSLGIAITNNFELKAIHAKKEVYRYSIIERWRDYFPSLTVSYMRNEEASIRDPDSRQHSLTFQSDFIIYDGGKRGLSYDIAKLESILARNDYRIALNRLMMQVQEAYLQALQLKGTIEIHRKTLERGRMQLDFIKKELELGEATKLNVLEIETKVKEIELNLERAMDEFSTALNRFKMMLKIDWRQPIDLIGDVESDFALSPMEGDAIDVDRHVSVAIKNRKEVESSDVAYAISNKSYLIQKLYYFPKFSMGLKYSLSDDQIDKKYMFPRERGWGINFKVTTALWGNSAELGTGYDSSENGGTRSFSNSGSLRVLDQLSYKRAIAESLIEKVTAREKKRFTREQISLEVLTSIMTLENSWNMIHIAKSRLDMYDSLLEIERLKADMGETIRYELIKKEIERGESAIAYLGAKVKYLTTASYLEIAMGLDIGQLKLSTMKAGVPHEN